jgi:uncharacterized membrane protein YfcA
MSVGEILLLGAIAFCGSLLFGITGFGAALISIPLATHFVPLQFALPLFALADFSGALRMGFENPKNAVRSEWLRLVPAIVVGTALGVTLLVNLPRRVGMAALGIFIIVYAAYAVYSLRRHETARVLATRWAWVAGLASGITGTVFGAGSPPYVMYLSQRGLAKEAFRATLGFATLASMSLRVLAFLVTGLLLDADIWLAAIAVLPCAFLGISAGRRIYLRVSREAMMRVVALALVLSGTSLLLRALT